MSSNYTDELLRELNSLRTDPEGFAERVLVPMLPHFQELKYCPPGAPSARTFEGAEAVKSAIDALRSRAAVGPITRISQGLTKSATDLVRSNGPRGALDNVLEDGTQIGQRIVRYGKWRGKASETISFGNYPPREAIAQWVVDDGNPTRSQQATLLEPRYQVVGMASGPHKTYDLMTVVIFAEDFEEGADASDLKYSSTTTASRPLADAAAAQSRAADHHHHASPAVSSSLPPTAAAPAAATSSSHAPPSSSSSSSSSSRKESVLASEGDAFVIETDPLDASAKHENLKLRLDGRVLVLTVQTEDADAVRTKTMKWELPFVPQPHEIRAELRHDHRLKMIIEKPNRDVAAKKEHVHIASFALSANESGGRPQLDVEVTQTDAEFVCRPIASKYDERVVVEHHNGEEIKFICTHEEVGIEDGNRVRKEITLTRVIRLPYAVPSANIHSTPDNLIKISKTISQTSQTADIPIHLAH